MQCQRRILGIRWSDFVTNSAVTEKTGHTRHTPCSHQWQKAGSVRTSQTPARRHSSTWRSSCVGWVTCWHGTTSWLAKKARKTAMYLVTWRSESDTFNCSGGLDSGWLSGGVESATVHRRLRVLMMMMMIGSRGIFRNVNRGRGT